MKTLRSRPFRHARQARGFALVITLSLMVLLTVISVGLMTLSTISLRSSSRGDAMATARANARIALALAIGELQTFAGPDQRITGTANLAGTAAGVELAPGAAPLNNTTVSNSNKGLTAVQPGTRYWTGVWRNSNLNTPGLEIYTKTPSPTHLQWLVSGNELSATPQFTPAANAFSVSADGAVADPEKAVLMVGPGSVGDTSSAAADNYVAVPLVEIAANGPAATATPGRYAWWIGDEGVKAKFNRTPSDSAAGQATTYPDLVSPRSGWEVVAGMEAYPTPDSGNAALLDRVITLRQSTLISPTLDPANSSLPQSIFHAATTDGFGVLADNLQGGLRIDLTATFAKGVPSSPTSTFPNAPATNANLVPTTVPGTRNLKGPKWGRLAAFHSQSKSAADGKLTVKSASSATDLTIAPIIVDLRLLMGAKLVKMDETQYQIHPCGKIAIALANPYPYPLAWNSDLELILIDETPQANSRSSRVWDAAGNCHFFSNKGQPAVFNNATFVIPKGELAPGEAQAFTMSAQVVRPANNTGAIKVNLRPFSSSSPSNFNNCIVQEETSPNTGSKSLDVRESWTTTQISAELRLSGGSSGGNPLRRLERFELDNGFFGEMRRPVTQETTNTTTQPFPMHLYAYQISQPGMRYEDLLPSSNLLGTRSSTLRTFMDFNLQAVRFNKLITSYNPPPYFMESSNSLATLPFGSGGDTGSGFTKNLAITPLAWGRDSVGATKKTVLFSFPQTFVSLAQLQHADLTADDEFVSVSNQPGNAVGNSYATPFVKRKQTIQKRDNYIVTGSGGGEAQTSTKTNVTFYDMSYLLNAALWDSYFFSTLEGGNQPLNEAITVTNASATDELSDPAKASSHLLIDGAFNINSTNKNAWKALLAGNRFLKHPADGAAGAAGDALFPRSLEQPSSGLSRPTGNGDDSYSGFRRLSTEQIDAVAEELVRQVRLRGPFVSLSHFVNRALVDLTARRNPNSPLSSSGALQSALDNAGANISPDGTKSGFTNALNVARDKLAIKPGAGNAPMADLWGGQANGSRGTTYGGETEDRLPVWAAESKDLNPGAMASIYADRVMITERTLQPEQGYRSTGIPGWITQADVLQAIGPLISARSDTFRVRGYGEALAPDGKSVLARAWCEAVVQRKPDYVDPTNLASERNATPAAATLTQANKTFGRRFDVISFRWLSQNEI